MVVDEVEGRVKLLEISWHKRARRSIDCKVRGSEVWNTDQLHCSECISHE